MSLVVDYSFVLACLLTLFVVSRKRADKADLVVGGVAAVLIACGMVGYEAVKGSIPVEGELVIVSKSGDGGGKVACLVIGQNFESIDLRCPLGTGEDVILEVGE